MEGEELERVVEDQLRAVDDNRKLGYEGYLAGARWLLASLMAINSGGLFAVLSTTNGRYLPVASFCFFAGLMSSFALGWFGQKRIERSLDHLRDYQNFLLEARRSGSAEGVVGERIVLKLKNEGKRLSNGLFLAGLVSFSIGAGFVALDKFEPRGTAERMVSELLPQ